MADKVTALVERLQRHGGEEVVSVATLREDAREAATVIDSLARTLELALRQQDYREDQIAIIDDVIQGRFIDAASKLQGIGIGSRDGRT